MQYIFILFQSGVTVEPQNTEDSSVKVIPELKPVKFLHLVHEGEANDEEDFVPLFRFPVQRCRMKVVHTPGPITLTRQSRPFVGDDSTSLIYNGKDIILLVLAKSSNVSLFRMPALPCSWMNEEKVTFCLLLNIPA